MAVLFIASFAECPRVWKMASTLSDKNFQVTILEWDRSAKLPVSGSVTNISFNRMKLKAPYGLKLFIILPIWWIYISFFLLLNRFDVVQTQNLDNLLPIWVLCRIKKIKIVYDIADFFADSYIPKNMLSLRYIVCSLERFLIRQVDSTIIADESRIKQINLVNVPLVTIYNSPPDLFLSKTKQTLKTVQSNFTLFYAGVFEKGRCLDLLIKTVQNMLDIELVFAGFGSLEKEIIKSIKGHNNIHFLGRISYNKVLALTSFYDCVIAFYDPSISNNIYASPNKLFEAMMCSKPIITNNCTSMSEKIKEAKCGLLVTYGNIVELKKALSFAKAHYDFMNLLGKNGRAIYLQKYDWSIMKCRLLSLYHSLGISPHKV